MMATNVKGRIRSQRDPILTITSFSIKHLLRIPNECRVVIFLGDWLLTYCDDIDAQEEGLQNDKVDYNVHQILRTKRNDVRERFLYETYKASF